MPLKSLLFFVLLLVTALALPNALVYDEYAYDYEGDNDHSVPDPFSDPLPKFLLGPQYLMAKVGENVIIPCDTTETSYVLLIKKRGTVDQRELVLSAGSLSIIGDKRYKFGNQQMEISNLRVSDAGIYICSLASEPPVEIHHTLEVVYPPEIRVNTNRMLVTAGDIITLVCVAEGNPSPTIKWSKQDGLLPSGILEDGDSSLSLANVDRHSEGSYVCTAENVVGIATSVVSVVVEYPPDIIIEKGRYRGSIGDTVELVCIIYSRPSSINEWWMNGRKVYSDSRIELRKRSARQHSLIISPITEADFGEYVCSAENKLGITKANILLSEISQPIVSAVVGEVLAGISGVFLVLLLGFLYRRQGQS